jgi:hypothetical protein
VSAGAISGPSMAISDESNNPKNIKRKNIIEVLNPF